MKYLVILLFIFGCNTKSKKESGSGAAACPTTAPAPAATPTPTNFRISDGSLFSDTATPATTPAPATTTPTPATTPATNCATVTPTPATPSTPAATSTTTTTATTTGTVDTLPTTSGTSPATPTTPTTPTSVVATIRADAQSCAGFYKVMIRTCDTSFNKVECFENMTAVGNMFAGIGVTNAQTQIDALVNARKTQNGSDLKPISCGTSKTVANAAGVSFVGLIGTTSSFDQYSICAGTGISCQ